VTALTPRSRRIAGDVLVALAYALVLVAYSSVRVDGRLVVTYEGWSYLVPVAHVAMVLVRRAAPGPVLVIAVLLDLVSLGTRTSSDVTAIAIVLGTLVHERGRRVGGLGAAFVAGSIVVSTVLLGRTPSGTVLTVVVVAAGFAAGELARTETVRRVRTARLLEENAALQAARARADEREVVTREVHDVLTHTLALTTRLADVCALSVGTDPDRAREVALEVARVSRRGLAEVRTAIGVLDVRSRDGSPEAAARGIEDVLSAARSAGLPLTWTVVGDPPDCDTADVVRRTVQEALTNVMKHSVPSRVVVEVAHPTTGDPGSIVVSNDGAVPSAGTGGHGLRGLARRLEAVGGSCESRYEAAAGLWVLRAVLPAAPSARGARSASARGAATDLGVPLRSDDDDSSRGGCHRCSRPRSIDP
jgi:signal transduction histidine kinase